MASASGSSPSSPSNGNRRTRSPAAADGAAEVPAEASRRGWASSITDRLLLRRGADEVPSVPGYHLLDLIGRGVVTRCHRAVRLAVQQEVALKLVHPELAAVPGFAARFLAEAAAAARVRHPNLIATIESGIDRGVVWQALELTSGRTLDALVHAEGPLAAKTAVTAALDCARALEALHAAGLRHGDIRPSAVVLGSDGIARLGEPGSAGLWRAGGATAVADFAVARGAFAPELVAALIGITPGGAEAATLDIRSDLHALGGTLVWLLTASPPWVASDQAGLLRRASGDDQSDPLQAAPGIPAAVAAVVRKAVAHHPEERYASPAQLREDLERVLHDFAPIHARRATVVPPRRPTTSREPSAATEPPAPVRRRWLLPVLGLAVAGGAVALAWSLVPDRIGLPASLMPAAPARVSAESGTGAETISPAPATPSASESPAPGGQPPAASAVPAVVSAPPAVPAPTEPAPVWASAHGADQQGRWADLTVAGVRQRMRWCPPGAFWMGSPPEESGRRDDERQVLVTISHGFWLGDSEVTQALWQAVAGDNPSHFRSETLPVEMVSWLHADAFVRRLRDLGRAPARLPSEAEWEYACRAGGTQTTPGWTRDESGGTPRAVRTLPPNAWGLHDLHGNVMEWCLDAYASYPQGTVTDPRGLTGVQHVARGGAWCMGTVDCRAAARARYLPVVRYFFLGLRVLIE